MTEQLNVQQMAEKLLTADDILILCHKNPDGDTVGCGSALYYALKALEKTTAVLCSDTVPSRYAFTNPRLFKGEFEPRTVIAVDVAGLQLFGENNGVPQFARHVDLCIDHHAGNNGYADFTLLDASAAAAAALLYQVIVEMGVTITPHIADCLYTGIATDTGCFKFSSTTANTHKVAAKLIEAGCHVEELNTLLFDTKPRARMEAERIARNHLEYYLDGRCALIYLTRDEIRQSGVDPADLEELTGLPISIEGVKVGLTLRQQPGGSYRISVRTAKGVDACAIARRLGYIFIDTGAMFRAVTLYALEHGAIRSGIVDEDAVVGLLDQITITFRFNPERGASDIYVNGDLAEGKIRTIEVSNCVSQVSAIPAVRRKLVAMQQEMGRRRGVVMDGRDIGTVVFPDAELKIFMPADPKVRACRRYDELRAKGDDVSLEEIERNVRERDKADMSRAISPLRQADDAVVLDNSCMTVEQQMAWFMTELERINK